MEQVQINSFTLTGITARTTNAKEMNIKKAKIGGLWQQFFKTIEKEDMKPELYYGVYNNYESNDHGAYDITTASKGQFPSTDSKSLTIPSGTYLKFVGSGDPKEAVIGLWQEIWNFFQKNANIKRSFVCDFEEYKSIDEFAIYIGIKDSSYEKN